MLVSMPENRVRELAECYGTCSFRDLINELKRYDAKPMPYRVTITRFGRFWYLHIYIV